MVVGRKLSTLQRPKYTGCYTTDEQPVVRRDAVITRAIVALRMRNECSLSRVVVQQLVASITYCTCEK